MLEIAIIRTCCFIEFFVYNAIELPGTVPLHAQIRLRSLEPESSDQVLQDQARVLKTVGLLIDGLSLYSP